MRSAIIFWYYIVIALIVIVSLVFVDFSQINQTVRLVLVLALVLLVANPLLQVWVTKGGETRLRHILGDPNVELQLRAQEVEKQMEKLRTENEHLKELDKGKSEFVAMTAHQLRTPLSAIKWTFHMITNGDLGPVTPEQRSFLDKGYAEAEKVITVVNDWLNLDYLEANRGKYQMVPSDISELIDGVVFEFNERLRNKNINMIVERPKNNMPKIMIDPIKFSMLMENLMDNALKYTSPGGKIIIGVNDDQLNSAKPEIEVKVADSGIGIPKAEQEKIFQQFFRSSNATAVAPRGSGLGLYIVKQLAEGHGGKVRFESEEGKGTTFFVTIPAETKKV